MITLLPDAEKITSQYLRSRAEVTALFQSAPTTDVRIYSTLPAGHDTWPTARLVRVGGSPVFDRHFDEAIIQFDVWGGPKAQAWAGAETIRACLLDMPGTRDGGVVTGVKLGGLAFQPDTSFVNARPRYRFDVQLWLHP